MKKAIYFDMDGTIADLYAVKDWLPQLQAHIATPYVDAPAMLNMSAFARLLHKAQRLGYTIGIVSWLSKDSDAKYDKAVTTAKMNWLGRHLPSVMFDEIVIAPHGTPKWQLVEHMQGVLFDDEQTNRDEWAGVALTPSEILDFLRWLPHK